MPSPGKKLSLQSNEQSSEIPAPVPRHLSITLLKGAQLQPSDRPALLAEVKAIGGHHAVASEVKAGGLALHHVEAPADRSAPVVKGAQVGTVRPR